VDGLIDGQHPCQDQPRQARALAACAPGSGISSPTACRGLGNRINLPGARLPAPDAGSERHSFRIRTLALARSLGDCRPSSVRVEYHSKGGVRKAQGPRRAITPCGKGEVGRSRQAKETVV